MREEFAPPATDWRLEAALQDAYRRIESGGPPAEIAATVTAESGFAVTPTDLLGWFGSVDPAEAALLLRLEADPTLVRRAMPDRDELIEITGRLLRGDAPTSWWLALLAAHVPHPAPSNLIFHPPAEPDYDPGDPESIVDKALAHRAIAL